MVITYAVESILFAYGRERARRITSPAFIATPPMGWSSWNAFGCNKNLLTELAIESTADALISSGLADAGYIYVNIDDCWMDSKMFEPETNGSLVRRGPLRADPSRFTNGSLASLASYLHQRGLRLGIYLDAGQLTCGGDPGSRGFEAEDVKVLTEWKVDYLKLDCCYLPKQPPVETIYTEWSSLLSAFEKQPIVFSCSYPAYNHGTILPDDTDWKSTKRSCNLWRLYHDIGLVWNSVESIIDFWANNQDVIVPLAEPNNYNDPDFLIVGQPSVTLAEAQTQMSLWAIFAAPLIISTKLETISDSHLATLLNPAVLDVNQDPAVMQGRRIVATEAFSTWVRVLVNYSVAVAVVNRLAVPQKLLVHWDDIIKGAPELISASSLSAPSCRVSIYDLWLRVRHAEDIIPARTATLVSPGLVSPHGTFFIRVDFSRCCLISEDPRSCFFS